VIIVKNRQLLGEAGVAGPLIQVLTTHLQSAAVMEQACRALSNTAYEGEWRRMTGSCGRRPLMDKLGESKLEVAFGLIVE